MLVKNLYLEYFMKVVHLLFEKLLEIQFILYHEL